jgi:uncharacterized protein YggE
MNAKFALAGLAALLISSGARAEDTGPSPHNIAVLGEGSVKHPADSASFSATIRGEGKTSVEAMQAMAEQRKRVEAGLNRLAGASRVDVSVSGLEVREARKPNCDADDSYRPDPKLSEGPCAVQGYVAAVHVDAQVWPATKVGDAASLAAQLGAVNISVGDSAVDKPEALKGEAMAAAIADARRKAQQIAAAAGLTLGPILKVQDSQFRDGVVRALIVTAQKCEDTSIVPVVPIDLKPEPVTENAQLSVTFGIAP